MSEVTSTSAAPVDTAKVLGRRILRFESIDQAMAEVDRLVEAERAGRLKHLGNWTLGQTLGHLAAWTEYGYTGSPLKVPFFVVTMTAPFAPRPPNAAAASAAESTRTLAMDSRSMSATELP